MRRRASSIFFRSFLSRSRARSSSAYSSSIVAWSVGPGSSSCSRRCSEVRFAFSSNSFCVWSRRSRKNASCSALMYCEAGARSSSASVRPFLFAGFSSAGFAVFAAGFFTAFPPNIVQPLDKKVPRQILADEDHGARALLVLPPGAAQVAAHQHVHALEHDPMRVALHVQDPLVAQHVRAVDLHDSGEEFLELRGVEGLVRAEHEGADVLVVLVPAVFQEIRVELEGRVQVEAADVENLLDRRIAEMHIPDRRARIHFREASLELLLVGFRNEVGLRHENAVGEADLLLGLAELVELPGRVLGVHHGDDAVQEVVVADLLVDEEALRDRPRVRHSGGLDDDAVELELARVAPLFQLAKDADKVPAHGAAHAAVVHLDDLLVRVVEQDVVVHARLAELVLDHRDAPAVLLLEDAVDERGLAAPQETGEYGHRNHVLLFRQPVLLAPCAGQSRLSASGGKKFARDPGKKGALQHARDYNATSPAGVRG